jgi:hypothetical protein
VLAVERCRVHGHLLSIMFREFDARTRMDAHGKFLLLLRASSSDDILS